MAATNKAVVKSVLSGDTIILRGKPKASGPPPERLIALNYVQAPRLGNKDKDDEPFAFLSRDFLRKLIVGKEISFKIDYTIPTSQREYGQVFVGTSSESVAVIGVREGWLKVREPSGKQAGSDDDATILDQLKKLEGEAQTNKKGIWGDKEAGIRTVKNTFDGNAQEFADKYKGKTIEAIVEQIRDASNFRVLLMLSPKDHQIITLFLSGVKAPSVRKEDTDAGAGEAYGEEAKFFVESRLLQRGVQVILESTQGNNGFIGSVIHPAGNIAEALLSAGLARCADWSLPSVTGGPTKLRAAEKAAKDKRLKIWTDHVAKVKQEGSEFEGTVVRVVSADTLLVRDNNRTGVERKLQLASIKQPAKEQLSKDPKSKEIYERGYQWEAREFLRKRTIGKHVHVIIDYTKPQSEGFEAKDCATIKLNNSNLAELLVERGLATVIRHRRDDPDRASDYDALLMAEEKAKTEGKGLHSTKEAPLIRYSDASESAAKARQFLPYLQRSGRISAVVDYVANGSRFNLLIPKESCRLTFVLSGVRAPRTNRNPGEKSEPFAAEALDFATRRCMQRDVEVEVESADKAGGFIGSLFLPNGENFAVSLLEEGFATIHEFSADQSPHTNQLYNGERKAKTERKGLWVNYDAKAEEEAEAREQDLAAGNEIKREYVDVEVSEVVNGGSFYVQIVNDQIHRLERMMEEFRPFAEKAMIPPNWKPKVNEVVSAKFTTDETWYRAKVRRHVEQKSVEVVYVDYGNSEIIPLTRVKPIDPRFTQLPHQANEACLSFLKVPAKEEDYGEEAYNVFCDLTTGKQLVANVDGRDGHILHLTLYDPQLSRDPSASLNAEMVREGLATVDKHSRFARGNEAVINGLLEALEDAKRNRLNMFEYGDITADE